MPGLRQDRGEEEGALLLRGDPVHPGKTGRDFVLICTWYHTSCIMESCAWALIEIYDLTCSIQFSGVNTPFYLAISLLVDVKAVSSGVCGI